MYRKILAMMLLSISFARATAADNAAPPRDLSIDKRQGVSVRAVTPVFSQLVSFAFPTGFQPAYEDSKGRQYIQESVLNGENVNQWTQMITLTGAKDLALNPNVTPARFADSMAGGFKQACPDSFSAKSLGEIGVGKHKGFAAVITCGIASPDGEPYSEGMLLLVVRGEKDYYTLQWAERGKPSRTPIGFDDAKWTDRMRRLMPLQLCPIIPGEAAPYSSCADTVQ